MQKVSYKAEGNTDFDELFRLRFAHENRYHKAGKIVGVIAIIGQLVVLILAILASGHGTR